jgi:hypothetical protein
MEVKTSMAINPRELVYFAVGFFLFAVLTPIGIGTIINTTTTTWGSTLVTVFKVVVPIIYLIGGALYFIPKLSGK